MDRIVWAFIGATGGLFCYVLGYVIGEFRGMEKVRLTREEMEIDDISEEKEMKIKDVEPEKNDSEEN
jgi:hypothetical protein